MSVYDERPWLARYRDDYAADIDIEYRSGLDLFRASLERDPECQIVRYFDGTLTMRELDELSDAFAVALSEREFARAIGSRPICKMYRRCSLPSSVPGKPAASWCRSIP